MKLTCWPGRSLRIASALVLFLFAAGTRVEDRNHPPLSGFPVNALGYLTLGA